MIKAVFFDLFETLVTESSATYYKQKYWSENYNVENDVFVQEWTKRQRKRFTGMYESYSSLLEDISKAIGVEIDKSIFEEYEIDRREYMKIPFHNTYKDIAMMLEGIKSLGCKIGLISNASSEEVEEWRNCSLHSYFDDTIFSFNVGCMKPEAEIYLIACSRLGVNPNECIFIGDGCFDELKGAKDVGMQTYCAGWFKDRWEEVNTCDYFIEKMLEPKQFLDVVREAVVHDGSEARVHHTSHNNALTWH